MIRRTARSFTLTLSPFVGLFTAVLKRRHIEEPHDTGTVDLL